MKELGTEKYTPPNQGDNPVSYEIKALTRLEFTRVMADGSDELRAGKNLKFQDIILLLELGLVDPSIIPDMPSEHHIRTAGEIYKKSALSETERKN